jgi:hypothetical protein
MEVHNLIKERLSSVNNDMRRNADKLANEMMSRGGFTRIKCSFGLPASDVPEYFLPMPELSARVESLRLGISGSRMSIKRFQAPILQSSYANDSKG